MTTIDEALDHARQTFGAKTVGEAVLRVALDAVRRHAPGDLGKWTAFVAEHADGEPFTDTQDGHSFAPHFTLGSCLNASIPPAGLAGNAVVFAVLASRKESTRSIDQMSAFLRAAGIPPGSGGTYSADDVAPTLARFRRALLDVTAGRADRTRPLEPLSETGLASIVAVRTPCKLENADRFRELVARFGEAEVDREIVDSVLEHATWSRDHGLDGVDLADHGKAIAARDAGAAAGILDVVAAHGEQKHVLDQARIFLAARAEDRYAATVEWCRSFGSDADAHVGGVLEHRLRKRLWPAPLRDLTGVQVRRVLLEYLYGRMCAREALAAADAVFDLLADRAAAKARTFLEGHYVNSGSRVADLIAAAVAADAGRTCDALALILREQGGDPKDTTGDAELAARLGTSAARLSEPLSVAAWIAKLPSVLQGRDPHQIATALLRWAAMRATHAGEPLLAQHITSLSNDHADKARRNKVAGHKSLPMLANVADLASNHCTYSALDAAREVVAESVARDVAGDVLERELRDVLRVMEDEAQRLLPACLQNLPADRVTRAFLKWAHLRAAKHDEADLAKRIDDLGRDPADPELRGRLSDESISVPSVHGQHLRAVALRAADGAFDRAAVSAVRAVAIRRASHFGDSPGTPHDVLDAEMRDVLASMPGARVPDGAGVPTPLVGMTVERARRVVLRWAGKRLIQYGTYSIGGLVADLAAKPDDVDLLARLAECVSTNMANATLLRSARAALAGDFVAAAGHGRDALQNLLGVNDTAADLAREWRDAAAKLEEEEKSDSPADQPNDQPNDQPAAVETTVPQILLDQKDGRSVPLLLRWIARRLRDLGYVDLPKTVDALVADPCNEDARSAVRDTVVTLEVGALLRDAAVAAADGALTEAADFARRALDNVGDRTPAATLERELEEMAQATDVYVDPTPLGDVRLSWPAHVADETVPVRILRDCKDDHGNPLRAGTYFSICGDWTRVGGLDGAPDADVAAWLESAEKSDAVLPMLVDHGVRLPSNNAVPRCLYAKSGDRWTVAHPATAAGRVRFCAYGTWRIAECSPDAGGVDGAVLVVGRGETVIDHDVVLCAGTYVRRDDVWSTDVEEIDTSKVPVGVLAVVGADGLGLGLPAGVWHHADATTWHRYATLAQAMDAQAGKADAPLPASLWKIGPTPIPRPKPGETLCLLAPAVFDDGTTRPAGIYHEDGGAWVRVAAPDGTIPAATAARLDGIYARNDMTVYLDNPAHARARYVRADESCPWRAVAPTDETPTRTIRYHGYNVVNTYAAVPRDVPVGTVLIARQSVCCGVHLMGAGVYRMTAAGWDLQTGKDPTKARPVQGEITLVTSGVGAMGVDLYTPSGTRMDTRGAADAARLARIAWPTDDEGASPKVETHEPSETASTASPGVETHQPPKAVVNAWQARAAVRLAGLGDDVGLQFRATTAVVADAVARFAPEWSEAVPICRKPNTPRPEPVAATTPWRDLTSRQHALCALRKLGMMDEPLRDAVAHAEMAHCLAEEADEKLGTQRVARVWKETVAAMTTQAKLAYDPSAQVVYLEPGNDDADRGKQIVEALADDLLRAPASRGAKFRAIRAVVEDALAAWAPTALDAMKRGARQVFAPYPDDAWERVEPARRAYNAWACLPDEKIEAGFAADIAYAVTHAVLAHYGDADGAFQLAKMEAAVARVRDVWTRTLADAAVAAEPTPARIAVDAVTTDAVTTDADRGHALVEAMVKDLLASGLTREATFVATCAVARKMLEDVGSAFAKTATLAGLTDSHFKAPNAERYDARDTIMPVTRSHQTLRVLADMARSRVVLGEDVARVLTDATYARYGHIHGYRLSFSLAKMETAVAATRAAWDAAVAASAVAPLSSDVVDDDVRTFATSFGAPAAGSREERVLVAVVRRAATEYAPDAARLLADDVLRSGTSEHPRYLARGDVFSSADWSAWAVWGVRDALDPKALPVMRDERLRYALRCVARAHLAVTPGDVNRARLDAAFAAVRAAWKRETEEETDAPATAPATTTAPERVSRLEILAAILACQESLFSAEADATPDDAARAGRVVRDVARDLAPELVRLTAPETFGDGSVIELWEGNWADMTPKQRAARSVFCLRRNDLAWTSVAGALQWALVARCGEIAEDGVAEDVMEKAMESVRTAWAAADPSHAASARLFHQLADDLVDESAEPAALVAAGRAAVAAAVAAHAPAWVEFVAGAGLTTPTAELPRPAGRLWPHATAAEHAETAVWSLAHFARGHDRGVDRAQLRLAVADAAMALCRAHGGTTTVATAACARVREEWKAAMTLFNQHAVAPVNNLPPPPVSPAVPTEAAAPTLVPFAPEELEALIASWALTRETVSRPVAVAANDLLRQVGPDLFRKAVAEVVEACVAEHAPDLRDVPDALDKVAREPAYIEMVTHPNGRSESANMDRVYAVLAQRSLAEIGTPREKVSGRPSIVANPDRVEHPDTERAINALCSAAYAYALDEMKAGASVAAADARGAARVLADLRGHLTPASATYAPFTSEELEAWLVEWTRLSRCVPQVFAPANDLLRRVGPAAFRAAVVGAVDAAEARYAAGSAARASACRSARMFLARLGQSTGSKIDVAAETEHIDAGRLLSALSELASGEARQMKGSSTSVVDLVVDANDAAARLVIADLRERLGLPATRSLDLSTADKGYVHHTDVGAWGYYGPPAGWRFDAYHALSADVLADPRVLAAWADVGLAPKDLWDACPSAPWLAQAALGAGVDARTLLRTVADILWTVPLLRDICLAVNAVKHGAEGKELVSTFDSLLDHVATLDDTALETSHGLLSMAAVALVWGALHGEGVGAPLALDFLARSLEKKDPATAYVARHQLACALRERLSFATVEQAASARGGEVFGLAAVATASLGDALGELAAKAFARKDVRGERDAPDVQSSGQDNVALGGSHVLPIVAWAQSQPGEPPATTVKLKISAGLAAAAVASLQGVDPNVHVFTTDDGSVFVVNSSSPLLVSTPHPEDLAMSTEARPAVSIKPPATLARRAGQTLVADGQKAVWQAAAMEVRDSVVDIVLEVLRKTKTGLPVPRAVLVRMLETELGRNVIGFAIAVALRTVPKLKGPKTEKLAEHLSVNAMSAGMSFVTRSVFSPVIKYVVGGGLDKVIDMLPDDAEAEPVRVDLGAGNSEASEEAIGNTVTAGLKSTG